MSSVARSLRRAAGARGLRAAARHAVMVLGITAAIGAWLSGDTDENGPAERARGERVMFPQLPASPEPPQYRGMLASHNRWRSAVGAPELRWSEDAARQAQSWAEQLAGEQCQMRHNPDPARRTNYGENIYRYWRSAPYEDYRREADYVVDAWGAEAQWYDLTKNRCDAPSGGTCGHYTQLIWAGSKLVGCGRAHCGNSEVWVCNYYPRGNYVGMRPLDPMPWDTAERDGEAEPADGQVMRDAPSLRAGRR